MSGEPRVHEEAGQAIAEAGQVVLDGPDGVAVTLSPEAARETGRRLIAAADEAAGGAADGATDSASDEAAGGAPDGSAAAESEAHPS